MSAVDAEDCCTFNCRFVDKPGKVPSTNRAAPGAEQAPSRAISHAVTRMYCMSLVHPEGCCTFNCRFLDKFGKVSSINKADPRSRESSFRRLLLCYYKATVHREDCCACNCRFLGKSGKVPSINSADPRSRESSFQSAENQGQHPQIWAHLPFILHWQSQAEEQGPHFQISGKQMQHSIKVTSKAFCKRA